MRLRLKRVAMVMAIYASSAAALAGLPGVASLQVDVPQRAQPLSVTLWYPAVQGSEVVSIGGNAVFEGTAGQLDASVAEGTFPLVLVSHGGMRSAPHLGEWIGAALAQRGFIALVVPAPRLGLQDAAIAPAELWKRPADISASLTALEHRIGAVLVVDPEMSGVFSAASLAAIKPPFFVINQGGPRDIPPGLDASGLAGAVPRLEYHSLAQATQFSAFSLCKPGGAFILAEEGGSTAICTSDAKPGRERIHAELTALIGGFFIRQLSP